MKVLDTSGILRTELDFSHETFIITNSVLDEIRDETARIAVDAAIKRGNIGIEDPKDKYLQDVRAVAEKTGDLVRLSETDIDVLALALEKKLPIISDDYNIQNTALALGIDFEKTTAEGIRKQLRWSWVCEGCNRKYSSGGVCSVCGSQLKRKAKKA